MNQYELGSWCYLSVLPSSSHAQLCAYLHARLVGQASELVIDHVLFRGLEDLCDQVLTAIQVLERAESWRWLAELNFSSWPDHSVELNQLKRLCLERDLPPPPPLRYEVSLELRAPIHPESQSLTLCPVALSLITALRPDLGRRIGDELDGQRPDGERDSPI